jgi:4-hydroxyacetophenone monooxygenase
MASRTADNYNFLSGGSEQVQQETMDQDGGFLTGGDENLYRAIVAQASGNVSWLSAKEADRTAVETELRKVLASGKEVPCHPPAHISKDILAHLMNGKAPGLAPPGPVLEDHSGEMEQLMLMELTESFSSKPDAGFPEASWETSYPRVAVIGAGASGLCAAIKMREQGIAFKIFERNQVVGGVWPVNTYPEAGCDVPSHYYSFSFRPNPNWSRYYSKAEEIAAYMKDCAEHYDVARSIAFSTEVTECEWVEARGVWRVSIRSPEGVRVEEADVVISAVGQLSNPNVPPIPGRETFGGDARHTAEWGDLDTKGKRVAIVGTGASSMQLLRKTAEVAKEVTVLQLIPSWCAPAELYHIDVEESMKWRMANIPLFQTYYRLRQFHCLHGNYPALEAGSEMNNTMKHLLTRYIERECEGDPELLKDVMPTYPPFCSRILIANDWYKTLRRDNVRLVPHAATEITRTGIVANGEHLEVDVIVYSTGFKANNFLFPMRVLGRSGVDIREQWREEGGATAYLGITSPGLPNMFMCYGPNTNLGHGGSIIFHTECQVRYLMGALQKLRSVGRGASVECKKTVAEAYYKKTYDKIDRTVWGDPGCTSWYKTKDGRVLQNSPWTILKYFLMTKFFSEEEYIVTKGAAKL